MIEEGSPVNSIPNCHAERCPNCNGFGTLAFGKKVCHSCQGKGFVIIPNETPDGKKEESNEHRQIFK